MACVFVYWVIKHLPEVIAEVVQEIGYGLRGEESPAAQARRQRLTNAGYDPASGGAFGQYTGNLWRDFWTDRDSNRRKRRADRGDQGGGDNRSWWQRRKDDLGEYATRQADRWQRRSGDDDEYWAGSDEPGDNSSTSSPDETEPWPDRGRHHGDDDEFFDEWDEPDQHQTDPERNPSPAEPDSPPEPGTTHRGSNARTDDPNRYARPTPAPHSETRQDEREPIRVDATVGQPEASTSRTATAVLELEEGDFMSATVATRGIPVTGIQSGAQECLSINLYLEAAISEFQAQLDALAARTHYMGEQTLGIVQFSGQSSVVTRMAQAAEAIAATKAQAAALGSEVGPLLIQTRTEFLLRS